MMRKIIPFFALVLAACQLGHGAAVDTTPAPQAEWPALAAQASQEAGAGRFSIADRLLTDFAARYPASNEAGEATYWRAMYKLDPSNPNASPREAGLLLDAYVANAVAPHRTEAFTLRRIAAVLEGRTTPAPTQASIVRTAPVDTQAADKAKDDELARLRDELAKANAELERIRKRLAQPTKPQ
jgi:hypothetical protein